jgi:hypothetical protein
MCPSVIRRGCHCQRWLRYGSNSTPSYRHRLLLYHSEAPMKPPRRRARPSVQTDLFDRASSVARLAGLQRHHEEFIDLVSQLLWQVASGADQTQGVEDSDEQDQC